MALGFTGMTVAQAEAVCEAMSALKGATMKAGDVAAAALFLASDEAAFVSGHNLVVDGATTALGPKPPGVAIITGAASGIGEAAARLFAEHGARVVIADIQDELGAAVAASIGADRCKYYRCDVRDEQQVSDLVDFTVATFGRLDVMYSNAGIICRGSLLQMNLEDFDNVVAVNTRGCVAAVKHAGRAMAAAGTRGSIICTASVAATVGGMGLHAYTVSKHAVLGLVRSAAGELGHLGIRVNCVSPAGWRRR
uniref:Short-chain dehydrogenase reductase 3b-like n=1 Tax=Ananas comosus var. bracteatus TaxID=296719 RepID=A0A6V7Q6F6_ANACO|nr:unnamed protein product [Ananas comosus var. bracteatus]